LNPLVAGFAVLRGKSPFFLNLQIK